MGIAPIPAHAANIEYLRMVQAVVDRLAQSSFQTKNWSVGLVTAILAFGTLSARMSTCVLAFLPAVCFLALDVYYLRQERLFRTLYRAALTGEAPAFSMNTQPYEGRDTSWWSVLKSPAILLLHGPVMIVIAVVVTAFTVHNSTKG